MGLNVTRQRSHVPYPFDPKGMPTTFWERLNERELGLTRAVIVCVLRANEIHTFAAANITQVTYSAATDIKVWFGRTRVWVKGTSLDELHLLLLKGESCVLYEGRDAWNMPDAGSVIKTITVDEGE